VVEHASRDRTHSVSQIMMGVAALFFFAALRENKEAGTGCDHFTGSSNSGKSASVQSVDSLVYCV
jgi:hypothetical protein